MTTYPAHVVQAWRESIAKWRRNAEAQTPEEYTVGSKTCPLCEAVNSCWSCPVRDMTGLTGCGGTPYNAAEDAAISWAQWPNVKSCAASRRARAAATVMADWLEALDVEEEGE